MVKTQLQKSAQHQPEMAFSFFRGKSRQVTDVAEEMPSLVYTCKVARHNECDNRPASSALVVSRKK